VIVPCQDNGDRFRRAPAFLACHRLNVKHGFSLLPLPVLFSQTLFQRD